MLFKSRANAPMKSFTFGGMVALLAILHSCMPPKTKQRSSVKEFENSSNICRDISNFATEKSKVNIEQDADSIFADKKLSERRILVDLIGNYQGALSRLSSSPEQTKADPQSVASGIGTPPSSNSTRTNSSGMSQPQGITGQTVTNLPSAVSSDGSGAGCSRFAGVASYGGIPPHYSQVKDAETLKQIVSRYCGQLKALDSPSCKYIAPATPNNQPQADTRLCANLGEDKPSWISDSCDVISSTGMVSLNTFAGQVCKIIGKAATSANTAGCSADIVIGICSAHAKGAGDVINYMNSVNPSQERINQQMIDTITGAFYKTALSCVKSIGTNALKEAIKANADGVAAYWAAKTLGADYVQKVLTNYKPNVTMDAVKDVAYAVCSAAANSVADKIGAVPPSVYANDCGPRTEEETQAQVASCFRTSASACDSLSGKVDFAKIVGAKSGGLKVTADVVSAVAQTGCSVGGDVSKAACGVISESTKAIIEAVRTGNNSWADCAGTTKIGQCIGSLWGSGGWTNNNGVSEPIGSGETQKRDCCWCLRTWYENDWGSDTAYKRENWVGVIQQGDFQSGNCVRPGGNMQGHKWWVSTEKRPSGWDVYYSYSQCKKVTLKGDSCVLGAEYYENGRPSGYVIRNDSWQP